MVSGMEGIVNKGGYREKQELARMLDGLDWFKNFGYDQCKRIERIEAELADELRPEDQPDWLQEKEVSSPEA